MACAIKNSHSPSSATQKAEDGIHRDHGARHHSDSYEYSDGYSQGYYDAVHEDPDFQDDEEEDW